MCGIVGAIANRDVVPLLLAGLEKLEYRGYDSAGVAVINGDDKIQRLRSLGKVAHLAEALAQHPLSGHLGIAHTRWATHGEPSTQNAHPHFSNEAIAIVHNGIIENYSELRQQLQSEGYHFESETDTEVIAHLIHQQLQTQNDLLSAIRLSIQKLEGAYSLAIMASQAPRQLYAVRSGSPLVIGLGHNEHFLASDPLALLNLTQRFIYLEEGDIALLERHQVTLFDADGKTVQREIHTLDASRDPHSKGEFAHYMLKEIFEQPEIISDAISGYVSDDHLIQNSFGHHASLIFPKIQRVCLVACGTSYHAGLVAAQWLEALAGIPCRVEVASEHRYRAKVVEPHSLFVALSQSGETADTLAALRQAKKEGYEATLAICNVPESSLVREADMAFMIRAGVEIGVAATKTFSTQLVALMLLTLNLGQYHRLTKQREAELVKELKHLPVLIQQALTLDAAIQKWAHHFVDKADTLFLGRGVYFPIALEGALKLKEISYIHAEAYPAGELKHGPLALIDKKMPVIVLAPKDELSQKLASNIEEVRARGGIVFVFSDEDLDWKEAERVSIIKMPASHSALKPVLYTIPLQLLAYHVALLRGTDIDQPRNLAKSVTVE